MASEDAKLGDEIELGDATKLGDAELGALVPAISGVVIDLSKALARAGEARLAAALLSRAWAELYRSGSFAKQVKSMEAAMHFISRLDVAEVSDGDSRSLNTVDDGSGEPLIDLRPLAPIDRHSEVIGRFEALQDGECFVFVNDHDPKPLYYQLKAEYDRVFQWEYLREGPEEWIVRVTVSDDQKSSDTSGLN